MSSLPFLLSQDVTLRLAGAERGWQDWLRKAGAGFGTRRPDGSGIQAQLCSDLASMVSSDGSWGIGDVSVASCGQVLLLGECPQSCQLGAQGLASPSSSLLGEWRMRLFRAQWWLLLSSMVAARCWELGGAWQGGGGGGSGLGFGRH